MDTTPFWLVWTPFGKNPMKQHLTQADAEAEAKRLAQIIPGQEFVVLRPVLSAVKSDLVIRRFGSGE